MNVEINSKKTVYIKTLQVEADVRYWEDATIDGIEDENGDLTPCKYGSLWMPLIEIETGKILNWHQGVKAEIHFKVCDQGCYYLQDKDGQDVLSIVEGYVPGMMSPKSNGYGDYIIMDIDENGIIQDWKPDFEDFLKEETF